MNLPDSNKNSWKQIGLKGNPFNYLNAAQEEELPGYFVPIAGINDDTILEAKETCLVTGSRGSGKTALRRMVAVRCWPQDPSAQILCLEYTSEEIQKELGSIENVELFSNRHARTIARLAERVVDPHLEKPSELSNFTESLDGLTTLRLTAHKLADLGFTRCLCLVDGIDEVQNPARHGSLLAPLLEFASLLVETPFIFHFFLPPELLKRPEVIAYPNIRWDRIRSPYPLSWEIKDLQRLVRQRFTYYSEDPENPIQQLGQLCSSEPELNLPPLSRRIDQEIIDFIYPVPQRARALIDLARMLLERHISNNSGSTPITQTEWRALQEHWLRERSHQFGLAQEKHLPFTILDEQIQYSGRELTFPNQTSKLLLMCLVKAAGAVVSHNELVRFAWPGVKDLAAVSSDAVKQAVLRLRSTLKSQGVNPDHIQSVRGLGYRIIP